MNGLTDSFNRLGQPFINCPYLLSSDNPLHKIYFTTDASTPDAFNRSVNGREVTHKYKAPFGLKVGRRYVRAVAYTR